MVHQVRVAIRISLDLEGAATVFCLGSMHCPNGVFVVPASGRTCLVARVFMVFCWCMSQ